ncbi:hypothetical protein KUTeg_013265 [Tegillarca granosa]|uniref:Uncharacterized protein n=1 Tax=Tegillarca granosa TaxID=220873 RepID=A0ABQ9ET75_TEGGR|nr:hypothetical protein KUTeg_013265 [Tegillarca granosa]
MTTMYSNNTFRQRGSHSSVIRLDKRDPDPKLIQASPRERTCVLFVKHLVSDDEVSKFKEEFEEDDVPVSLHMIEFTTKEEVSRYTSKCMIDREATESEERSMTSEYLQVTEEDQQVTSEVLQGTSEVLQGTSDNPPDEQAILSSDSNLDFNSLMDGVESLNITDATRQINEVKVTAVNDIEPTTTAENNQQMSMPNTNIRGQIVDPSVQAMAIPYPANRISTNQLINFPFPAFPNGPASPLSGGVTSVNRNQNTANSGDLDNERKKGQQNMGVAGVRDNSNKETNTAQDNTDKTADKETSNPIAYLSKNYTSDIADGKTDSCASPKSDVTGESILTSYCLQQYLHKSNSAPAVNQAAAYGQQTQQWQQQLNVQPPQQMQPLPLPQQIQSPPPQQQMHFGQLQQKPEFLAFNDYGQPVGFESCPVPTQIPLSQDQPQNIPSDDVQLNNMNKVQTRILYTRDTEFNISGGSVTNSADSEIDNTKASLSTKQTQTEQRNREEEMSNGCEPSGAASFLPPSTDSNGKFNPKTVEFDLDR